MIPYALIFLLWLSFCSFFLCFPFFFFLQRKMKGISNYVSGSRMSKHDMWTMKIEYMQLAEWKHVKWRCMIMQWLMHMQCMNMINDKCRNDMSPMMPWRDAWCDQGTNLMERIQKFTSKDNSQGYFYVTLVAYRDINLLGNNIVVVGTTIDNASPEEENSR